MSTRVAWRATYYYYYTLIIEMAVAHATHTTLNFEQDKFSLLSKAQRNSKQTKLSGKVVSFDAANFGLIKVRRERQQRCGVRRIIWSCSKVAVHHPFSGFVLGPSSSSFSNELTSKLSLSVVLLFFTSRLQARARVLILAKEFVLRSVSGVVGMAKVNY